MKRWIVLGLWLWSSVAQADLPDYCYDFNDRDHDGHVYGSTGIVCPRDDCNDEDASIYPGAPEICGDGIDQDCNGADLSCPETDVDRDGFLSLSAGGDDCDDTNPAVHPGAVEVCGDGLDNDCIGGDAICVQDADNDGYGAQSSGGNDCDDNDPAVHPHAAEICGDQIDQDCANGDPPCAEDIDGDGHGNPAFGGMDCDDFDRGTYPGAPEICGDGRDQDCDGSDLACPDLTDQDSDGHLAIDAGGDDCNDHEASVHPEAEEVCGDQIDQDCDGRDLSCTSELGDADGDGYLGIEAGGQDCNDGDAASFPGAPEICGDSRDQDCDGSDAVPGLDPQCADSLGTNSDFEQAHARGVIVGQTEPSSCASAGGAGGLGAVWLLALGLLLWRRRS